MSTHKIEHLKKLDKFESNHYPILTKIQSTNPPKMKKYMKITQKYINKEAIMKTINNSGLLMITNNKRNKKILYNKILIWPTIKIQGKANKILGSETSIENKQIT